MKEFLKKNGTVLCSFCAAFISLFFIMWWSPLSSDDLEFAGHNFQDMREIIKYILYYGNGRFMGNLGGVIMSYMPLLRIFVKSTVIATTIIMIPKVLGIKSKEGYLLSFLLMFGLSPVMFSQVYQWTSGFQNYIPPVLLLLMCLYIYNNYDPKSKNKSKDILIMIVIFVLGFLSQLYVENSTVASLITSGFCLFYSLIKKNGKRLISFTWFLSVILGGITMFIIPKIFYIPDNRVAGYRSFEIDIISSIVNSIFIADMFIQNTLLFVTLSILALLLLKNTRSNWKNQNSPRFIRYFLIVFACYVVYLVFLNDKPWFSQTIIKHFISLFMLFLFVMAIIEIIVHLDDKKIKCKLWMCFSAAILFTSPILIVSPIGERCLFLPYVFLVMGAIIIFQYCIDKKWLSYHSVLRKALIFSCIGVSCFINIDFAETHWINKQSKVYIQEQIKEGSEYIEVPDYPSKYVHPVGEWALQHYYYREEWDDISFKIVAFEDWYNERIAESKNVQKKGGSGNEQ